MMAVRPGEENVATLFGDVHYFYSPETARPRHHRFDKGSYVYLFENANTRTSRVEIANCPGTDDQDAFEGFLDHTRVRYSYKQQCVVSITVDGVPGAPIDQTQWHLPTFDPNNQAKYHYRLHSLDIYFWTHSDALQFVNGVRRLLPPAQVEVADEPGPPAHSPYIQAPAAGAGGSLVQKLENMAISDPQYAGGSAGPVASATPDTAGSAQQQQAVPAFVPMAYNPAAPAAPEQITHREKTPPPEDDGHDPLAAAVARDHAPTHYAGMPGSYAAQTFSAPPGQIGLPGPPAAPPPAPLAQHPGPGMASPGFAPPQFGQLQRSATMPVAAPGVGSGLASPGLQSPYANGFPQHQQLHAQQQPTPPPPAGQPLQSPGLQSPPGGFAQYNYGQVQQQQPQALQQQQQQSGHRYGPTGGDWSVHQQVYRPTEQEYVNHKIDSGTLKPQPAPGEGVATGEKPSRLGQNAERLEKGVTGMLKKFEKKFG
ncbi:uncharacterized protein B0I36DRAFT_38212 [Microdochium trichocladiopsis]|uniref:RNA recognition motif-containing protein n=1 Tax=Microdochium trichocladiopsis TaxID=1682393 RepID=A0A9P8XXM6_9PEZI|nr:uncharacterized protein B0I36DRAFT_38212 [Microdochium trichocladiopsis]KAH7018343.1 hypothetical protein B0I36DRAFT_38212 [Microdochium trichocladiopsis]